MKMSRTNQARTVALTLLAPVAWGTTYITVTEFLPPDRPLLVATSRVVPAGIALLIVGRLISNWRPQGVEWRPLIVIALLNFALFFPLLIVGAYRLPGGVAAATGGLQPLLVTLADRILFGERAHRTGLLVGLAAAVGVALVVTRTGAGIDPLGVAAAVGANLLFAVGVVLTKRAPVPPNRIAATGWQLLISSLVLIPLTVVVEGVPPAPTVTNLGGFAYLSLVGTAMAFAIWFSGIRRLPVAGPPLLGLVNPITGAALGWIVLGEDLSLLQLLGFIVTIGAIVYGATLRDPDRLSVPHRRRVAPAVSVEDCPQAV